MEQQRKHDLTNVFLMHVLRCEIETGHDALEGLDNLISFLRDGMRCGSWATPVAILECVAIIASGELRPNSLLYDAFVREMASDEPVSFSEAEKGLRWLLLDLGPAFEGREEQYREWLHALYEDAAALRRPVT